jgi:hypothetical protein
MEMMADFFQRFAAWFKIGETGEIIGLCHGLLPLSERDLL